MGQAKWTKVRELCGLADFVERSLWEGGTRVTADRKKGWKTLWKRHDEKDVGQAIELAELFVCLQIVIDADLKMVMC
jgi:hypothetical protein